MFAELAWTPADLTQAEDRAHRVGQDKILQVCLSDRSLAVNLLDQPAWSIRCGVGIPGLANWPGDLWLSRCQDMACSAGVLVGMETVNVLHQTMLGCRCTT